MVNKSEQSRPRLAVPGDRVVFLLLLAAYVLGRIPFLRAFDLVEYDGTYYINQARSLIGGLTAGGAYPIGYPASIALLLPIVRDGVRAAQAVSFLAGIGSVWVVFALGRRMATRASAFLVALAFAFTPLVIRSNLTTLSESIFICWVLLGFYLFERGRGLAFGVTMGLAAVTRPEGLGTFAALFLLRRRPRRRVALAVAGFLAVYAVNVIVLSFALDRLVFLPKGESFGTTTSRWQARETWIDFSGSEELQSRLQPDEGANAFLDAVSRYPRELLLFARHLMPAAALLALFGMLKRRSFLVAGFFAFLFYPFYTPRSDARYILPYIPFALLYAAIGLDAIRGRRLRGLGFILLAVSTLAGLAVNRQEVLAPVSDGFQWAKRAGLAWRDRVRKGDEVADRKPYFAFYAGAVYVKIPIAPYDETIGHLFDNDVRFLLLHRDTIDPLRPAIAPLLHDEALIRGELRYRQADVREDSYILYERTGLKDSVERARITRPVEGVLVTPSWSPDGETIAYRWISASGSGGIFVAAAGGGEARRLLEESGTNDPLSWTPDSRRICFAGAAGAGMDICLLDLETGALEHMTKDAAVDRSPSWSADGREIVFASNRSGNDDIWSLDPRSRELTQITHDGGNALPAVSPDRKRLAWRRQGQGLVVLDRVTGRSRVIRTPKIITSAPSWSPDGRFVAITAEDRAGGADVYLLDPDTGVSLVLTKSTVGNGMPSWSPDGRKLAVVTNENGDFGVWVLTGLEPYLDRLRSPLPVETLDRMK